MATPRPAEIRARIERNCHVEFGALVTIVDQHLQTITRLDGPVRIQIQKQPDAITQAWLEDHYKSHGWILTTVASEVLGWNEPPDIYIELTEDK